MSLKVIKEILYWFLLVVYGLVLFSCLLYLRFPTKKFHGYCEKMVERKIPGVVCTIGKTGYEFPFTLILENVALKKSDQDLILYEDSVLAITPSWHKPTSHFTFTANPFGGKGRGTAIIDREKETILLKNSHFSDLDISKFPVVSMLINRKVSGIFAVNGDVLLDMETWSPERGDITVQVAKSRVELKKPILQQKNLQIDAGKIGVVLDDKAIQLTDGTFSGKMMSWHVGGKIALAGKIAQSSLLISGRMKPKAELYKKNPNLKVVVGRLAKRSKDKSIQFKLAGTAANPTFIFGK